MTDNPFDLAYQAATASPPPKEAKPERPQPKRRPKAEGPRITKPGAYADIPGDDYHAIELCPEHSISSSGLKLIEAKSPAHYWAQSHHNPNAKPREQKKAFAIGHLLHDVLLYKGMVPAEYHIVPDGFVAAHTNKWADEMDGYYAAVEAGMNILTQGEFEMVRAMAEACDRHELASALITAGTPEMTLAAQDPKTGRWMRARPDVLPTTMEIIPDVKTAVSGHPDDFEKAATKFGHFQSAAHYLDVLDILYGEQKRQFVEIVIEKGSPNERHYPGKPYPVTIYHLDDEDIHHGRMLNRHAMNLFDECLRTGEWPDYTSPGKPILPLQMTAWAKKQIQQRIESGELSYDL